MASDPKRYGSAGQNIGPSHRKNLPSVAETSPKTALIQGKENSQD